MKGCSGSRKLLLLAVLLTLCLLLSACGGIMTGTLAIDSAFSGSRTITCSVKQSELNSAVEGGVDTIHQIVKDNCPKAFKYRHTTSAGDLTYFFTMSFTDAESYRTLIRSVLPDTRLELLVGDGELATGIRLKEDFTDRDLMQWFDDALYKSGKYKAADNPIWEQTSCSFTVDGVNVSNLQPFTYDTYQGITLSEVALYTTVFDNGALNRECVFRMPKDAYDTAGDQFAKYVKVRMPEGAESTLEEGGQTVTQRISFSAADAASMNQKTETLFGNRGLFAASTEPTSPFSLTTTYSEYLSFDAFPAERVSYYVKAHDAPENAGLSDGYGGAILHDGYLSYPVEGGELSVSYARRHSYQANAIEVLLDYGLSGMESATVRMDFTGIAAAANAKNASDWYFALTDKTFAAPQLISTADGVTFSAHLTEKEQSLQALESWFAVERLSDTELEHRLFSDRVQILLDCDFSKLMEQSGAKKLTLTLKLPQGMTFTSVRQDGKAVRQDGNTYTLWNQKFTLLAKARVLRTDRIILAVLICVLLLIIGMFCAAAGIRLHLGRKGGKENESFLTAMGESVKGCFSGRMPPTADKAGVRYFYGKRGPQVLIVVGAVIVPLLWAITYLVCYEQANAFYFFSGMLRYLSVTLLVLCALTVPIAFIWRYYQKASAEVEVGLRMQEKTVAMTKTRIAEQHNRILSNRKQPPVFDTALMVPDAFCKRGSFAKRLLCKVLRQFSRKFPDIERPVCTYLPGDKIAASRSVVQNVMLVDDTLILTQALINPAFGTVKELAESRIPVGEITRYHREDTVLHAHYRDGLWVRSKRVTFVRATVTTRQKEKVSFVLPKNHDTVAQLRLLAVKLKMEQE